MRKRVFSMLLSRPKFLKMLEHPTSCSAKKLFCSGYFAGKIDPVLCVKMKYICCETFRKLFIKWSLSPQSGDIVF